MALNNSSLIDKGISILNGILGDYLKERNNDLTINMGFYNNNKLIRLDNTISEQIGTNLSKKICVLVHGLCCNESYWLFQPEQNEPSEKDEQTDEQTTFGELLKNELNYTPFFLRYNTGLRIAENGEQFSVLLDELLKAYGKFDEIIFIGHSMGGLIVRSGLYYAEKNKYKWIKKIKSCFYIGSPHLGAPLEKFGNVLTSVLDATNHPITKVIRDVINIRSNGIKDLRYGKVISEEDHESHNAEEFKNNSKPIPLLSSAKNFAIAGTLTKDPYHPISVAIGDALVTVPSACISTQDDMEFFKKGHVKIFNGIDHIRLGQSLEVYKQIKFWLTQ